MICQKPTLTPEQRINKDCESDLKQWYKWESKFIKLLLLGTGESGKTTILKQMKILHINGFSDEEKRAKVSDIKHNVHESIYSIVSSMEKLEPPVTIADDDASASRQYILDLGRKEPAEYTDEYFGHVKILWADPDVQIAYSRSNEFQLIDSAQHFLDQIDTIKAVDYLPNVQDILYCRVETTSISKIDFSIKAPKKYGGGTARFSMYDVGGQRGHRKKWISVFMGIRAILFLIAASDFDQNLREDGTTNRLKESFQIFSDIFWSRYVRDAGKLVFLNKQDLLRKKIEGGKKLENYFPKYMNYVAPKKIAKPNDEYERAKFFMYDEIIKISKTKPYVEMGMVIPNRDWLVVPESEQQEVYVHFTVATDTKNVKLVFEDVHDLIIKINTDLIANN